MLLDDQAACATANTQSCRQQSNYTNVRRPYPFRRQERMETEDGAMSQATEPRLHQPPPKPPSTLEIPAYFEEFPVSVHWLSQSLEVRQNFKFNDTEMVLGLGLPHPPTYPDPISIKMATCLFVCSFVSKNRQTQMLEFKNSEATKFQ